MKLEPLEWLTDVQPLKAKKTSESKSNPKTVKNDRKIEREEALMMGQCVSHTANISAEKRPTAC